MKLCAKIFCAAALLLLASTSALAQTLPKQPKFTHYSWAAELFGLNATTGSCPMGGGSCTFYSASASKVNTKGKVGLADFQIALTVANVGIALPISGLSCSAGEGELDVIPNGNTANTISFFLSGLNLCHTQKSIIEGKFAAALEGNGTFKDLQGIADLALLIDTVEDHIDMELDGNFGPLVLGPTALARRRNRLASAPSLDSLGGMPFTFSNFESLNGQRAGVD